jgi:hypothetical protein
MIPTSTDPRWMRPRLIYLSQQQCTGAADLTGMQKVVRSRA